MFIGNRNSVNYTLIEINVFIYSVNYIIVEVNVNGMMLVMQA